MIWKAKEGKISWLPGLTPRDLPHPLPQGITVHIRGDELGIEIQGLAGAIPLLNGDTLHIVPKIGQVNFLRLLFKAEGLQRDLKTEFERFVEYSVDDAPSIDSVVARHLVVSAATILARGPKRIRVQRRRQGAFASGQLDSLATALSTACHKREPVAYLASERTTDVPENRLITEGLLRAWPMLDGPRRAEFRPIYETWMRRYRRSVALQSDLEAVENGFAAGSYGGPRDYYRRALMLALIVLGNGGIGFGINSVVLGDAVLLNTADIFEKYIRNVITEAHSGAGYVVTKGGTSIKSLYADGSFELKPDIVLSRRGQTLLIVDAKYKQPTVADHYQMLAYLAANEVKRGLLLAPQFQGDTVSLKEYATASRTVICEAYLPMSKLDITEAFLARVIERFA